MMKNGLVLIVKCSFGIGYEKRKIWSERSFFESSCSLSFFIAVSCLTAYFVLFVTFHCTCSSILNLMIIMG